MNLNKQTVAPVIPELIQDAVLTIIHNEDLNKSDKMKQLFDAGLHVKDIATLMSVRYNFVYNVISNYCIRQGIKMPSATKEGANKREIITEMHLAGKTNKEIAVELRANTTYVHSVIKAYKKSQEIMDGIAKEAAVNE